MRVLKMSTLSKDIFLLPQETQRCLRQSFLGQASHAFTRQGVLEVITQGVGTPDGLCHAPRDVAMRQEFHGVVLHRDNGAALIDVVIQLLNRWLHLQQCTSTRSPQSFTHDTKK